MSTLPPRLTKLPALIAALLASTALPALAETITASSTITAVTVYPDGAKITRMVSFAPPAAGSHELLVTDLPAGIDPGQVQLTAEDGLVFGAYDLRSDRLPPRDLPKDARTVAAEAAVDEAEVQLQAANAAVAAQQARITAAEAQIRFLTSFSGAMPENATPDSLRAMAQMVGSESLVAAEAVAAAQAALWPLQQAQEDAAEALVQAEASLEALPRGDSDYTALSVAIEAAGAAPVQLTLSHFIHNASWRPAYELHLDRKPTPELAIKRAVLVSQGSGEDWSQVALTLSSSRPAEQAAASRLWPEQRQIGPPEQASKQQARSSLRAPAVMAEPIMAADAAWAPVTAFAGLEGDTVVYRYPANVNIASGVEDLRLALDQLTATPDIRALAVPRFDRRAFVEATFTNPSTEPLLPGMAQLFRDGSLVGSSQLELVAGGEEAKIGFGAIDSLRLRRDMPLRDSGQRGLFSSAHEMKETAVLSIENLGSDSWDVRLLDQISYSEQQDLKITLQADPAPNVVDLEGQRGVLAWDFPLDPGDKQQITLGQTLSWPEGFELR